jgi:excisionase family DNA binding protein
MKGGISMNLPKFSSNEELPITMTAKDVAGYLNISLTSGYNLMNAKNFPTLRLGKQLRVNRDHFLNWLNNANEVNFK